MKSKDATYVAMRAQTEMKVHLLFPWTDSGVQPFRSLASVCSALQSIDPYVSLVVVGTDQVSPCVQKVERLKSQLHFIGAAAPRQHIVFVEDEAAAQSFSAEQHFDTPSELLDRSFNRPRTAQLQEPMQAADLSTGHRQRRADRSVTAAQQAA